MTVEERQRLETLLSVLVIKAREADKAYEQGVGEIMSNKEYDALRDQIADLENRLGKVEEDSPSVQVGYEVLSKLQKERHSVKMLSLGKTKDVNELKKFLGDKEGVLSFKMDGLTVVLTYNNGVLVKAVTRGNGEVGELVTSNAKHFTNIPKEIPFKGEIVIRGEAIITYSVFNEINRRESVDSQYKTPRNLCSGSVRQLDSAVSASRKIKWFPFEIVSYGGKNYNEGKYSTSLQGLKTWGFEPVEYARVTSATIDKNIEIFKDLVETSDIPTDGLVLRYNDIVYGNSLGTTAKSPRHSIAFKWQDEEHITKIRYVEWSPSRTGLINPVAVFEPVEIDGTTVQRASVHNVSILQDLMLGIGDRVKVYKANLIIPQISENLDKTGTCEIPSVCPVCGGKTVVRTEYSSGVKTLYCTNSMCMAKGNKLLEHFVSRDAMNIVGISGETINKLVEMGVLDTPKSFYYLKDYYSEITSTEGFGDTSFYNMVDAIEKSRKVKLANLIYALGIPNVGLATAKLICKAFNNDYEAIINADVEDFMNIPGVGEVIAVSIHEYFEENSDDFMELLDEVELIEEEGTSSEMAGVTICVTGDVHIFKNRRQLKDMVESLGGKVTGSVSKSTTYLVTNDTTSGSRKNVAAAQYGIPILTEEQFIEKYNLEV